MTVSTMTMKEGYADPLNSVGWFIPPFVQMGALGKMAKSIHDSGGAYSQDDLERELGTIYCPTSLAAMVTIRYPTTAFVADYSATIAEAVEAHVMGLDHVAVAGLVPVIEGAGRQLAEQRAIRQSGGMGLVFRSLIEACKEQATAKQMGAVGEVLCMLDSFAAFTNGYLYERSERYPLADRTNRHGITHGAYRDRDYGRPLNFFKTIAAVDFLTFVSTFTSQGSWMAPSPTPRSLFLAQAWLAQREVRSTLLGEPMPEGFAAELAHLRSFRAWVERFPIDEPVPW